MFATTSDPRISAGLLLLRIGFSTLLVYGHGWAKLANFAERSQKFSDPIGVGSEASLALVVFAEVVCAALVGLGLLTRLASVPIVIFTMVAVFVQHAADPFNRKELALVYAVPYLTLIVTGAGHYSIDAMIAAARSGGGRRSAR